MSDHRIEVGTMRSCYVLPRDQPRCDALAGRLDAIAKSDVPKLLGDIIEPLCSPADGGVWVIPRVELSFDVDARWDADRLASSWAQALARSLARTVCHRGDDSVQAIRYESRVEYLAALVADLAAGSAWKKWQYSPFEGLRLLPVSSAIRTVLIEVPEFGINALATLAPTTLRSVLSSLAVQDAVIVWSAFRSVRGAPKPDAVVRVIELWSEEGAPPPLLAGEAFRSLWLLARGVALKGLQPSTELSSAIQAIVRLDQIRAQSSANEWHQIAAMLISGSVDALPFRIRSLVAENLLVLLEDPVLLERAIQALRSSSSQPEPDAEIRVTSFGFVFLLLPLLDELPAEAWSVDPQLLRFAVLVRCSPESSRALTERDPLLRDLFGIGPEASIEELELSPGVVNEWMHAREHPAAEAVLDTPYFGCDDEISLAAHATLRAFAWKLTGFGHATLPHLWANFLDIPARLEDRPDRRIVHLARPPLFVILRFAGLMSAVYTLPHFDSRPFCIYSED